MYFTWLGLYFHGLRIPLTRSQALGHCVGYLWGRKSEFTLTVCRSDSNESIQELYFAGYLKDMIDTAPEEMTDVINSPRFGDWLILNTLNKINAGRG